MYVEIADHLRNTAGTNETGELVNKEGRPFGDMPPGVIGKLILYAICRVVSLIDSS